MGKLCIGLFIFAIVSVPLSTLLAREGGQQADSSKQHRASTSVSADTSSKSPKPLPATLPEKSKQNSSDETDMNQMMPWLIALGALVLAVYQYYRRRTDTRDMLRDEMRVKDEFETSQAKERELTAEESYRAALHKELGSIKILGSPDIDSLPVSLLDSFVSLRISETWRNESRFDPRKMERQHEDRDLSPEEILQRAFRQDRMLVLIGEPGSGKTTLMKFYAMTCLEGGGGSALGFKQAVLPLYLPLRDLKFKEKEDGIESLPNNLAARAEKHVLDIEAKEFYDWLHNRETLVLLDGLDEISDLKKRKQVCKWIDNTCTGLTKARFVVTSRWTGYRKAEGIELETDHLRADVRDFSRDQQEEFLRKWFRAVYLREYKESGKPPVDWQERQRKKADLRVDKILGFLKRASNHSLRELGATPMLLQIMAILWKERDILPESRASLYAAALNYLLVFRDRRRDLDPVLPVDKARRVLLPTALWMQAEVGKDEVPKNDMYDQMQPKLNSMEEQADAAVFCQNLVDRAGLLAEYGEADYIFRHKSFREYLAGVQLTKEENKIEWLQKLIDHFGDDWWEEPLRFFINEGDDKLFDAFMDLFFTSEMSKELDQKQQDLLQTLVREAPQRELTALAQWLNKNETNTQQRRYILECLKTIGTAAALEEVEKYLDKMFTRHEKRLNRPSVQETHQEASRLDPNFKYATEILAESARRTPAVAAKGRAQVESSATLADDLFRKLPASFVNDHEQSAEYILIPPGEFKFSVSKNIEPVPNIYFAKYPVTNKRYRRFIAYLSNQLDEQSGRLPTDLFSQKLSEFAAGIKDFTDYLGTDRNGWANKLRSGYDDNKRFNHDDQPVVAVTWFAARAYCFWLSCLQETELDHKLEDANKLANNCRLPTELEWEWAAAGRERDGSLRDYPWPKEEGSPTDKLANYGGTVGATTPVGRYLEGATPEGLLDMAGNVLEWSESWRDEGRSRRALRGGSWGIATDFLRCSARNSLYPGDRDGNVGFRVVRPQS